MRRGFADIFGFQYVTFGDETRSTGMGYYEDPDDGLLAIYCGVPCFA